MGSESKTEGLTNAEQWSLNGSGRCVLFDSSWEAVVDAIEAVIGRVQGTSKPRVAGDV